MERLGVENDEEGESQHRLGTAASAQQSEEEKFISRYK
jgi:hypothetical protein